MKVLAINCGSSTLKFHIFELDGSTPLGRERRLAYSASWMIRQKPVIF